MVLAAFMVDPTYLQEVTQAFTTLKQQKKIKKAVFIVAGDLNLPDKHWDT